ncbi:MAG: XdhC family protein [Acidobacteria bacterium]|nr:XdhC family protein [Acidobacteriota bacterium]
MQEIERVAGAITDLASAGGSGVLATLVDATGSTLRRPGARLLIREHGEAVGFLSAGCVEADLAEHAAAVMAGAPPEIVVYDGDASEDVAFGFGLGCRGTVRVLLERIPGTASRALEEVARARRKRHTVAVVTHVRAAAQATVVHLTLDDSGSSWTDAPDPALAEGLRAAAETALQTGQGGTYPRSETGTDGETFTEVIEPPVALLIAGSGADAVALCRQGVTMGWEVTVLDRRPARLTDERFPGARAIISCQPADVPARVHTDTETAVVILTHNLLEDRELLPALLRSQAFYVGLIGSRARTSRLLEEVVDDDGPFTSEQMARLYTPVGLDLGAESAEELALAIAAEILAARSRRSGGFLREGRGSLHEPSPGA